MLPDRRCGECNANGRRIPRIPRWVPGNVLAWAKEIFNWTDDDQPLNQVYPYDVGIGRSLLTLVDVTGLGALIGSGHRETVIGLLTLAGPWRPIAALVVGSLALWHGRDQVGTGESFALMSLICLYTSSTIYLYYLVILLVALALLIRDPSGYVLPRAASRHRRVRGSTSIVVLAVVIAAVVVPVPGRRFGRSIVSFGQVEILTVSLMVRHSRLDRLETIRPRGSQPVCCTRTCRHRGDRSLIGAG